MNPEAIYARIDLHCHSWASDRPTLWFMQRLGCPESFTSPEHVREIAQMRGMNFVTITDHNTIAGVQDIRHYDNVIVGNEITTYFPNNVKVHVVCLDITETQFLEIQEVRRNILDLVQYLNRNDILHFLAHPLHKVNGRLRWEHFEKLLLLFKRVEILNGSRLHRLNDAVARIVQSLTREDLERLADKHDLAPVGERPWEKYVVGGTDDHSGLFIGTCCTEVEVSEMSRAALLQGIREGKTRVRGASDGSLTLAHQVNSIAFQYYRSKIGQDSGDLFYILNRIFERNRPLPIGRGYKIRKAVKKIYNYFRKPRGANLNLIDEIRDVIQDNVALKSLFHEGIMTREEYNQNVFQLASDVLDQMILRVCEKPKLLHYFLMFAPVVLASYAFVCRNLHGERDLILQAEDWLGIRRKPKVAWFTDSLVNMDGVSKTCRMFLQAARSRGADLHILASHESDLSGMAGVFNFKPIKQFPTPGYDKVPLYIPSILQVFKHVEDQDYDAIVVSTPGPVGLMGLICGKLMRLPVNGIYHTDLPRIALNVTGDPMFGELAFTLTRIFYKHVDRIYSPSQWYVEDLLNMDIEPQKIDLLERWIDPAQFSPRRRDPHYWHTDAACKLLFVGRISRDKNVDVLLDLYQHLSDRSHDFVLHVVGDGPYFQELKRKTAMMPRFIMTGAKYKDELAKAYASSDLFVYPGLLDTFGNVIVEAQASGLPCVVMNEGGPQELILPNVTGVVANSNQQFIREIEALVTDSARRTEMSGKAAEYAAQRFAEERIFTHFWNRVTQPPANDALRHEFKFQSRREEEPGKVISLPA